MFGVVRSVKHCGGSVMALACMAFNGTTLVFIEDEDRSSRMNSKIYRDILSAQIQPNSAKLNGSCFTLQMDNNDPKHTVKATQVFKAKKWNILQWQSQSPLNPIEHAFHFKTKLKAVRPTNKQLQ